MKTSMFINFTNHPSNQWSLDQIEAAEAYGEIVDIPFPQVDPMASEREIELLAAECVAEIVQHQPCAVLCQGEFTLCYSIVNRLKTNGILVLSACSERMVETAENGRFVRFEFKQFRQYI